MTTGMRMGGVNEVADLLRVSRQRMAKLRSRPDFPEPIGEIAGRSVWDLDAIDAWNASGSRQTVGRPPAESRTRVLGGRFVIEEQIGHGGYADVFRGIDRKQTDPALMPVAIKVLHNLEPETIRRRERELRVLAEIDYQHVMPILGRGETKADEYYYVMPLARGSLIQFTDEFEGKENRGRLLDLMKQICSGLEHVHQRGVLHRDLKPGNVLRFEPDRWVLADFGLAVEVERQTTTLTATRAGLGTPWYTAPEQWGEARGVDEHADIFSLGRILQELYTGERGIDVPTGDLRRVILRATAQKPDERHHSVAEFLADVERAIGAGDITGWEPLEETAQRHLQRLRFQSTTTDELDEFLDWALALNPQDSEEAQALTSVLPALTNGAITDLWNRRPLEFREVFRAHCTLVGEGSFQFSYCDVLAEFARRVLKKTRDPENLRCSVTSLTELGRNHNRWHVQGVVTGILQGLRQRDEIDAAIDGLNDADVGAVAWTITDFSLRSLAPELRKAINDLGIEPN
jgi:serine/threonine protein kinase